ncbi:MAG: hypothetical protein WA705_17130 [Candidatus Ozemobacteraceae bacterium]
MVRRLGRAHGAAFEDFAFKARAVLEHAYEPTKQAVLTGEKTINAAAKVYKIHQIGYI